jgi:hypothetical protein
MTVWASANRGSRRRHGKAIVLPFTTEQFLGVFERYNQAIWPMQVVAYLLGLAAVALAIRPARHSDRVVSAILAFFWLWTGAAYHLAFFRQINPLAAAFGVAFILQAILFAVSGMARERLTFRAGTDRITLVGWLFVGYAMVAYPLIGTWLGHGYPRSPGFGVAPCPTAIFTFGLLLWTRSPVPIYRLLIPFAWSLLGAWAAVALGIREDIGLLIAGLLGTSLLVWRDGPRPARRGGWRRRFA